LRDPLRRRLQPLRYLHDYSDYFRLEHLPNGGEAGVCFRHRARPLSDKAMAKMIVFRPRERNDRGSTGKDYQREFC
jgi:hypothetical protein